MRRATTFYRKTQIRSTGVSMTARDTAGSPGERGAVLSRSISRRSAGRLVRGGALAVVIVVAACASSPSRAAGGPAGPPPVAPASAETAVAPATLTPFEGNIDIEDRLETAGRVVIAGERLHEHLVRRFYLAHHYKRVWESRPAAATALWGAVLHADRHGLDPVSFHAAALDGHGLTLTPVEHDLLLSDAVLAYADALARGAMPIEERPADQDLQPEPVDVVAAVDAAISSSDPGQAIAALAPAWPQYMAMRRAYAEYLTLAASGRSVPSVGARGRVARISVPEALRRARRIAINLERLRWLPRDLPPDRLVVNTATAKLQLFRDDRPIFSTRVVVGEFDKQTPELESVIKDVLFNPPWNVPRSIIEKEILPKLVADRHYLTEHHMRWRGPMAIQQEAGPYSALGRIKFAMGDRFDVYLHDTPEKWRFHAANRMMSHGCVRVENPRLLAALLLEESPEDIDKAIDVTRTHSRALPKPVPVFIVYHTADVESDGSIAFYGDPYDRDGAVWAYLSRAEQTAIAQRFGGNSPNREKTDRSGSTLAQKTATIRD
jgi:murein L,D-transpeptidase YcbB/YkuD